MFLKDLFKDYYFSIILLICSFFLESATLQITLRIYGIMNSCEKIINNIMTSLNHDFALLSNWFHKNFMALNPNKCSFMLFDVKDELQTDLVSKNISIRNSKEEKVVGITFDNKLVFSKHLTSTTKKTNLKLNTLNIL